MTGIYVYSYRFTDELRSESFFDRDGSSYFFQYVKTELSYTAVYQLPTCSLPAVRSMSGFCLFFTSSVHVKHIVIFLRDIVAGVGTKQTKKRKKNQTISYRIKYSLRNLFAIQIDDRKERSRGKCETRSDHNYYWNVVKEKYKTKKKKYFWTYCNIETSNKSR